MSQRLAKTKLCLTCSREFHPWDDTSGNFCSRYCFYEFRRVHLKCVHCGNEFVLPRWRHRYSNSFCSPECFHNHHRPIQISFQLFQLVLGSLLGDSNLKRTRGHPNYCFQVAHSVKDISYLQHKYNVFKSHNLMKQNIREEEFDSGFGLCRRGSFQTITHPFFTMFHEHFYTDGRERRVTPWVLKHMTEEGLAYWYQDDGNLAKDRLRIILSTQSLGDDSLNLIRDWFARRWGINCTIQPTPKGRVIYISSINGLKFIKLVQPYIQPSMSRKLPEKYPSYFWYGRAEPENKGENP